MYRKRYIIKCRVYDYTMGMVREGYFKSFSSGSGQVYLTFNKRSARYWHSEEEAECFGRDALARSDMHSFQVCEYSFND